MLAQTRAQAARRPEPVNASQAYLQRQFEVGITRRLGVDKILYDDKVSYESNWAGPMSVNLKKQFQTEDFLLYCLPGVARRASALCASEYFTEFGLKMPEWRLLAQVGRFGSISAKELSEKITMDQVAISRAAHKCVKRGLIRETTNPNDRRSKVLVLTSEGEAFFKRFLPRACTLVAQMEEGLTEGEVQTLKRLLNKLDKHLLMLTDASDSQKSKR